MVESIFGFFGLEGDVDAAAGEVRPPKSRDAGRSVARRSSTI
jgi:hypothetical protein